ncbi:hypothetical protein TSOC_000673 [Tetrabaena socialis]|uniref:Rhodanese domain-containing protein n=1 Tax=Tetrabaena socialis TaxID=47790 RepID=A0A2J8AIR8_9CHLO|nr:hypothetical protein TSOC_000673 [Tetrabaena socialis]|eukprot:PNH12419.1 hypothetical protein TSOC_000673 [Tetrabaena socialis]
MMPSRPLHAFLAASEGPAGRPALIDAQRPALIDLRDASSFMQSRLRDSYNVPLEFLVPRMFLLPDRTTPLRLVTGAAPEARTVCGAASAGGAKEDVDVSAFLTSRGWQVVAVLAASPEVLRAAAELGLLESGGDELALRRRWLFQPSQLLVQQVGVVERMLADARAPGGGAEDVGHRAPLAGDAARGGGPTAEPAPAAPCVTLRMLDLGCGSGRDLAWLSARSVLLPPSCRPGGGSAGVRVAWECVGLDSWHGALARCSDVLSLAEIPPGPGPGSVTLHLAEIEGGSGALRPLPPPPALKPSLLRYMAQSAGGSEVCAEADGGGGGGRVVGGPPAPEGSGGDGDVDGARGALEASLAGSADLVLCVRLLCRSLLPRMAGLLRPGGFILYSTFVDGPGLRAFGRPQGREHVLEHGELSSTFFGAGQGFEVLRDDVSTIPDGREVTMFCARKVAPPGADA